MAEASTSSRPESLQDAEKLTQGDSSLDSQEKRQITGFKWFLFLFSTLTAIFVYSLDNTIVANIAPKIVNDFNAVEDLPWLSVGFMIGGMAMILPFGKIYTLFDAKWVFIVSTIVFMAASALCGGAPTMDAEIIGRVFAGAGGNGMYFGLLALISMNTSSQERPKWLSLSGLVWGLGTVLGPVVGGAFELYTWRWAFYINLLFGAILLPTYLFKLATFDWVGTVLSVGAFTTLVMGINFGGTLYPWDSGQTIALFVVSGVLWIIFGLQQGFNIATSTDRRILPIHLFAQKEPVLLFISCAAVGAVSYVSVYYVPIYFQFTQGDNAIQSAVRLLPFIFLLITTIPLSGVMMSHVGYYKPWYVGGSIIALIPAVLMSTIVHVDTHSGVIYGLEIVLGLGAGAYTQAAFGVIQAVVVPAEAPNGLTLMLLAQLSGMTLGLSISGAIFVNLASNDLFALLPEYPQSQVRQIVSGTSGQLLSSLSEKLRDQALVIIVSAWHNIFICVYVAAAASLVCSIFMSHKKCNVSAAAGGA
ncbi:Major facilitator superfamily domain general substrate transporter [Penicillium chrysogenum]|uniref:Major facilitator superfamily domain general substrate transporter n=1 Tax=Penicillium chrysogenum TaxID=5076 RepID=A0ABQ8WCD3_PENCH|nr:Major facilitator superfamily domain general substrate transporter [Penicillium chrysogenum]KAJ5230428.1 Major facilitator superfamily domain general substrate transporter [Penicillium chrysogenum]KAJ5264277.1 Major facilitator superfamily domain general substrate transporter [Penicillium chrysogenum]KAJ6163339.1 Major facilitator superfamily domain general substrate transporter [Penicillium chrysogenum]